MRLLSGIMLLALTAAPAFAEVDVSFIEGAPKDRFQIANNAQCDIENAELTIDLEGSAGGLIFDVTDTGAGVEVFQPFEVVAGVAFLANAPVVRDGDRRIALSIGQLPAGQTIAFTIDVDDTINAREITVTDSELSGGSVRLRVAGRTFEQTFGETPRLTITGSICN
ncbi:MAG: aggregation factor core [Pseudomonadota bacterium]